MHKANAFLLAGLCCLSIASSASAADCFSPAEAEAEAALSFQAELRVTGLSCHTPDGHSLYDVYQRFMANNSAALTGYQDRLIAYYKTSYKGDPAARLHARETEIENTLSLAAAKQGLPAFCQAHAPQLQSAVLESPSGLERRIAAYQAAHPSSTRICASVPSR